MTPEQIEFVRRLIQKELSNRADDAYRAALQAKRPHATEHDASIAALYKGAQDEVHATLAAFNTAHKA